MMGFRIQRVESPVFTTLSVLGNEVEQWRRAYPSLRGELDQVVVSLGTSTELGSYCIRALIGPGRLDAVDEIVYPFAKPAMSVFPEGAKLEFSMGGNLDGSAINMSISSVMASGLVAAGEVRPGSTGFVEALFNDDQSAMLAESNFAVLCQPASIVSAAEYTVDLGRQLILAQSVATD